MHRGAGRRRRGCGLDVRHASLGVRVVLREREELPSGEEAHGEEAPFVEVPKGTKFNVLQRGRNVSRFCIICRRLFEWFAVSY